MIDSNKFATATNQPQIKYIEHSLIMFEYCIQKFLFLQYFRFRLGGGGISENGPDTRKIKNKKNPINKESYLILQLTLRIHFAQLCASR
jgi:hypothetical protein